MHKLAKVAFVCSTHQWQARCVRSLNLWIPKSDSGYQFNRHHHVCMCLHVCVCVQSVPSMRVLYDVRRFAAHYCTTAQYVNNLIHFNCVYICILHWIGMYMDIYTGKSTRSFFGIAAFWTELTGMRYVNISFCISMYRNDGEIHAK